MQFLQSFVHCEFVLCYKTLLLGLIYCYIYIYVTQLDMSHNHYSGQIVINLHNRIACQLYYYECVLILSYNEII